MNIDQVNGDTNGRPLQPKSAPKLPACADCKRLKVKCVRSDPNAPNSPCLHCLKKNLACIYGTSSKRHAHGDKSLKDTERRKLRASKNDSPEAMDSVTMRDQLLSTWNLLTLRDDLRLQLLEKYDFTSLARPSNNILDRGLFSRADIVYRLKLYRSEIYTKFPVVECPVEEDFEGMMRESPVLFHTILDISSLMVKDESQLESSLILHNLVLKTVVDEIMIVSVKSLELLKCLVLLTHWYNESELYHQQRLHVLTSLAVSVSYDLGMGGTAVVAPGSNAPAFEQMVAPTAAADSNNPEYYRIWLAVYSALFQSLSANRRPVNSLWNKYTEQAVLRLSTDELLMSSAPPSFDVWELAWLRHIQERIALSIFKKDNEPVSPDYNDPDVQVKIQQFDDEINNLRNTGPSGHGRRDLALYLSRIFLHQAVLYTQFDEMLGRAPFTNFSLNILTGPLPYAAVRSFSTLVQCSKQALTQVLNLPSSLIAPETTSFWTSLTLSCDILLKCRACCIFNRYYAAACFVTEDDLRLVTRFTSLCDRIIKEYPNCNNAVSYGFFIKLILCYHDARAHYQLSRVPIDSFGDPAFVMKMANNAQVMRADMRDQPTAAEPMSAEDTTGSIDFSTEQSTRSEAPYTAIVESKPLYSALDKQVMTDGSIGLPKNPDSSAEVNGDSQSYISSPFSPISIDVTRPPSQSYDMNAAPVSSENVELDVTALNEIDSFWTEFVNAGKTSGPFGLDFPV